MGTLHIYRRLFRFRLREWAKKELKGSFQCARKSYYRPLFCALSFDDATPRCFLPLPGEGAHCAFVMRALRIIIILYFICFCERQKHLLVNNKIIGNALQFAFPLKSAYECALLHHRASCLSTSFQFGPCLPLPLSVPISTWTLCYLLTTFIDFERQQRHLGLLGPLTLSSICLYLSLMSIN